MRESRHVEPYLDTNARRRPLEVVSISSCLNGILDTNARRGPLKGVSISSYLNGFPRGHAKRYAAAVQHALECRAAAGEVVRLPSIGASTAYHRVSDLPWPLTIPMGRWLSAHSHVRFPLEIDCSLHLRRHEIATSHGWEVTAILGSPDARDNDALTITLHRPQGPGDPSHPVLASLLTGAARELAARPDDEAPDASRARWRKSYSPAILGWAAALMHARDCLEAAAIARAVSAEIERTGRVTHALRSAADPAWVALRALEDL
jgi:hypothetical protein